MQESYIPLLVALPRQMVLVGVRSYLGSRPDSAMKDRMTAFVKLKGESFLVMISL